MAQGSQIKKKAFIGTIWSSVERFSVQGIAFVVMLFMARLLSPKAYGLVGMLTVFIAISQSLIDSGFSQALIRKQDRSKSDCSTVFIFNLLASFVLYAVLYFSAPLISNFYNEPQLTSLTRIISFSLIINSFVVVQRALYTVDLNFKIFAKAGLISTIISGSLGILSAYQGFGVWAIVIYQLLNFTINTIILWLNSKWKPSLEFSTTSFKELFGFGSKIAAGGILSTIYDNLYLIIIGKIYNPSQVGLYTRAYQFGALPSTNISSIIQKVSYPTLCELQNDLSKLRNVYMTYQRLLAFIIFPMMAIMIALAVPFVRIVLGEKWDGVIIPLQLLCCSLAFYPAQGLQINILNSMGRSDLYLKIDIIKKIVGIICLLITLPFGLNWLCAGQIIATQIALLIHFIYTKRLIQVGILKQYKDIIIPIIYSLISLVLTSLTCHYINSELLQLIFGIIIGMMSYFIIAKATKSTSLDTIKQLIFSTICKKG